MRYLDAWAGRSVRTPEGEVGVVVSRSNGTAYLRLPGDRFERRRLGDLEAVDPHERNARPPRPHRRRAGRAAADQS